MIFSTSDGDICLNPHDLCRYLHSYSGILSSRIQSSEQHNKYIRCQVLGQGRNNEHLSMVHELPQLSFYLRAMHGCLRVYQTLHLFLPYFSSHLKTIFKINDKENLPGFFRHDVRKTDTFAGWSHWYFIGGVWPSFLQLSPSMRHGVGVSIHTTPFLSCDLQWNCGLLCWTSV